jgi:hypothetical protein
MTCHQAAVYIGITAPERERRRFVSYPWPTRKYSDTSCTSAVRLRGVSCENPTCILVDRRRYLDLIEPILCALG